MKLRLKKEGFYMKKSGMTSGYSVFFKGVRDWRSFDIGVMEKCIAISMVLSFLNNIFTTEFIRGIDSFAVLIVSIYFLVAPVFIYYRNFKTDESKYIFITPIKKSYIFLTSIKTWFIGVIVFIITRILIVLMVIDISHVFNKSSIMYLAFISLNLFMIFFSINAIVISTDIITVVKNIPKIITYYLAAALIFSRVFIPNFWTYDLRTNVDIIEALIQPKNYVINDFGYITQTSISLGPSFIVFIISGVLIIYALSIFEDYDGETNWGLIKRFTRRKQ